MTLSPGLAGGIGLQGGTGVKGRGSVLCAPGLGQCRLNHVQLLAARLQLDPKQCCIRAVAGFLRQRGGAVSQPCAPPRPPRVYTAWTGEGLRRRLGGDGFWPPSGAPKG